MTDQSKTSSQANYLDTHNVISSRGSAAGQLPLNLSNGTKIALSGLGHAPASLIQLPDDKKVKTTRATCGQYGKGSSASIALQQSLESKLKTRLPRGGLTMFLTGWKTRATPLGRLYCQLVASARPTEGTELSLLQQKQAMWGTPRSTLSGHSTGSAARAETAKGRLEDQVFSLYTTPSSRDWKDTQGMTAKRMDGKNRNDQLPRQISGMPHNGSNVLTENQGSAQLNPIFSLWLMGFSIGAGFSMLRAMQSFPKLSRNSPKQQKR